MCLSCDKLLYRSKPFTEKFTSGHEHSMENFSHFPKYEESKTDIVALPSEGSIAQVFCH